MTTQSAFLSRLGMDVPIIQAPMAGVSTPQMAAAVSNAGGLGSLGLGASTIEDARQALQDAASLTNRALNANVFCHAPALRDEGKEAQWLAKLSPHFARFGAAPPSGLREIYDSFRGSEAMFDMLLDEAPKVVSFHFGLPRKDQIAAFADRGIVTLATATNLDEARQIEALGIDAVVAQGWEAGGHRGTFDENAPDSQMGTFALTRLLVQSLFCPVIAAGGVMDGAGIRAALDLGAVAVQMGTAFIACDESSANQAYQDALASDAAHETVMTRIISGRPARCLSNKFTALGETVMREHVPSYPVTYDAGKALNAAAMAGGETGYGAHWAGQGAPLSRRMSTSALMAVLQAEL